MAAEASNGLAHIDPKDVVLQSLKRSFDLFASNYGRYPEDEASQKVKLAIKLGEYASVKDLPLPAARAPAPKNEQKKIKLDPLPPSGSAVTPIPLPKPSRDEVAGTHPYPSGPGMELDPSNATSAPAPEGSKVEELVKEITSSAGPTTSTGLIEYRGAAGSSDRMRSRALISLRAPEEIETPQWHAPWKLMRVIAGHQGWVRSVAVEPGNEWFVTGSNDRTIKIWDLASGTLKLTLTGHIGAVCGLAVSNRHPYLFSVGDDKLVKCWDLETNKVTRHYHGHLSGVYCCAIHPTIDVLVTGGRDSTARVWDMRTKAQVHALASHTNTVCDVKTQGVDPQIITGSADMTVKYWDLAAGRCLSTLTNHKKSVRALVLHPREFSMMSASADNLKKWKFPDGEFVRNFSGHKTILNTLALNPDNVLVSAGDNGSMYFWDWRTGYNFQQLTTRPQSGSMDCETAIFASTFDHSGARLITCEADKSIKMWKEDENATPETHPVQWKPKFNLKKY